jgi:hypothetical protein
MNNQDPEPEAPGWVKKGFDILAFILVCIMLGIGACVVLILLGKGMWWLLEL